MKSALVLAAVAASSSTAPASCAITPTLVTYYKSSDPSKEDLSRCEVDAGKCARVELKGYLFEPPVDDGKTHPVVVFNHGSEQYPGDKAEMASWFAIKGYVVFVPHRRGHGKSTGEYLSDHCPEGSADPGKCKMDYLREQLADVEEAIAYVKTLPNVDVERIAFMGHSYGGITTMFLNQKKLGQKAVVDIAGGSQSWEGNPDARDELMKAARTAVAPVMFIEPLNDRSIEPTLELAHEAGRNCRVFQSALFPATDTDGDGQITAEDYKDADTRDIAHGTFTGVRIDEWAPSADEFMRRFFNAPAKPFDKLCQGTSLIP